MRNMRTNKEEISTILLYALAIGFFFSFDNWGTESSVNLSIGFFHLISYTIGSLITLILYTYGSKFVGQSIGVHSFIKTSYIGLFISLLIVMLSEGKLVLFIPPGFSFDMHPNLMKGRFYRHQTHKDFALSGIGSIMFQLIALLLISTFSLDSFLLFSHMGEVLMFSILFSLIPFDLIIKPFEKRAGQSIGSSIIFKNRGLFVFIITFILVIYLVSVQFSFFVSLLFATFASLCIYLYYKFKIE